MPPEIERLSNQFLQNPVQVTVAPASSTSDTITQYAVASDIEDWEKRSVLRGLIDEAQDLKNGIIFCNRKKEVANLLRSLERHGYSAGALHGDMDQTSRMAMLKAFKENKVTLLVASDVAARGLDIPDVSHVFNFDVPVNAEDYVHRIGRTGRAGRKGTAYMVVTPEDQKGYEAIETLIDKKIDWLNGSVEWDAKARKRKRSGSKSKTKDDNTKTDKRFVKGGSGKTDKGEKNAQIGSVDYSDANHAFGGEENVPAFLLRAG